MDIITNTISHKAHECRYRIVSMKFLKILTRYCYKCDHYGHKVEECTTKIPPRRKFNKSLNYMRRKCNNPIMCFKCGKNDITLEFQMGKNGRNFKP